MRCLLSGFIVVMCGVAFAKDSPIRQPGNDGVTAGSVSQVQLCEGTEAFGSEGQGVAVSALLNYSSDKKCEVGLAFSFEYGAEKGFQLGRHTPYSVYPIQVGKTVCTVTEENGEFYMTLTRAPNKNAKPGRPLKILVDRCKLSEKGI